jgi:hypothetical protein
MSGNIPKLNILQLKAKFSAIDSNILQISDYLISNLKNASEHYTKNVGKLSENADEYITNFEYSNKIIKHIIERILILDFYISQNGGKPGSFKTLNDKITANLKAIQQYIKENKNDNLRVYQIRKKYNALYTSLEQLSKQIIAMVTIFKRIKETTNGDLTRQFSNLNIIPQSKNGGEKSIKKPIQRKATKKPMSK